MLNKLRNLIQNKANKPSRRTRQPLSHEGSEGDFVISRLKDGLFVFFKVMSQWLKIFHSRTSLVPDQNKAFDLGSPTKRWKNLYLSNNAINIGDSRDLSVKISTDGTDLVFKNKAGTESKIVGKRADSNASNVVNEITLGDESGGATAGVLNLGAGNAFLGGFISGCANYTNQTQSAYLGVRFLADSQGTGDTSVRGLSIVDSPGITSSKVYLATHDNAGGHIGIAEHATSPSAVAGIGILYTKTNELYYRTDDIGEVKILTTAGSSSITGHLVPSADETYNLGSESYKWNNLYLKSDSLFLGDSHISTAESGSIEVSDASGNIIADSNQSLQTVTGTVILSDTTISAFSIGSTIISGSGDLKLQNGVELIVIGGVDFSPIQSSIQENVDDIKDNTGQINNLQNYTSRTHSFVETLQLQNQQILNDIEALGNAHNRLRNLIASGQDYINTSSAINNDDYTKYEDSQQ